MTKKASVFSKYLLNVPQNSRGALSHYEHNTYPAPYLEFIETIVNRKIFKTLLKEMHNFLNAQQEK